MACEGTGCSAAEEDMPREQNEGDLLSTARKPTLEWRIVDDIAPDTLVRLG